MGTAGKIGSLLFFPSQEKFEERQNLLRVVFGLPAVLMAEVLPILAGKGKWWSVALWVGTA